MRKDARNIPCKNVIVCEQFYTQILTLKKQGCLEKHKDLLGGIPELLLPPLHRSFTCQQAHTKCP